MYEKRWGFSWWEDGKKGQYLIAKLYIAPYITPITRRGKNYKVAQNFRMSLDKRRKAI